MSLDVGIIAGLLVYVAWVTGLLGLIWRHGRRVREEDSE